MVVKNHRLIKGGVARWTEMIGGADKAYTESDLLKSCRHYDSTLSDDEQTLLGKYGSVWMKDMIADRETYLGEDKSLS